MSDAAIHEQIAVLEDELLDLDEQVAAGDLDRAQADALASKYRTELEALRARVDVAALDVPGPLDQPNDVHRSSDRVPRRVSGRVLVGSAIVGVAIIVIGWLAVTSLRDDATEGAEGVVGDVISGDAVDLDDISNEQMEQVVAENPDVIPMRLALARRYFNAGEFGDALQHYFEVLDREQNPEALANVGWMTYLSGHPETALGYLEAALQRDPAYLPAKWFISNVLVDLGHAGEAVPYLVEVIESGDAPEEIQTLAVTLLGQIEAGS